MCVQVLEYLLSIETDTDDELKAIYHHDFALVRIPTCILADVETFTVLHIS